MVIDRLSLFIGKRTIKTALSVFITAVLCNLLNWPAIFAVLSALVSIEPTVNASVVKAKVRLPAAVVGAAFAMLFVWLLGHTPLAYALSVLFTIAVCHRLHWEDAIVVAALTSVNMLVLTEDHFLTNFFIRVGTTSLGIVVSIIVNYFVFPPDFTGSIKESLPKLKDSCRNVMLKALNWHLNGAGNEEKLKSDLARLIKRMDKTERLVHYQFQEFRYHRFKIKDYREIHFYQKELMLWHQILFHIGSIVHLEQYSKESLSSENKERLWRAAERLDQYFESLEHSGGRVYDPQQTMKELKQMMFAEENATDKVRLISIRSALVYEMVSVYSLLKQTMAQQNKHKHELTTHDR